MTLTVISHRSAFPPVACLTHSAIANVLETKQGVDGPYLCRVGAAVKIWSVKYVQLG